jgi:hypothetical protein
MSSATGDCSLERVVGRAEPCSGRSCAFWDERDDACVFHDVEHELGGRTALARHMLDLRNALAWGVAADRSRFSRLLNAELEAGAAEQDELVS